MYNMILYEPVLAIIKDLRQIFANFSVFIRKHLFVDIRLKILMKRNFIFLNMYFIIIMTILNEIF